MSRPVTALTGAVLVAAGALLHAASSQRWAGACPYLGSDESPLCVRRQDHVHDVLVMGPAAEPLGAAAPLAGAALVLVALALALLPWAVVTRPHRLLIATALASAVAYADAGVAGLRTGLGDEVVAPVLGAPAVAAWMLLPPLVYGWVVALTRGWARAGAMALVLTAPLVMFLSYGLGSFDAAPWYEAWCGWLTALAGACLLVAAARGGRPAVDPTDVREPADLGV